MSSVRSIFDIFKSKTNKEEVQIKMNIGYLIQCVSQFELQLNEKESCKLFLEYLSQLDAESPISDDLIEQFKTIMKNHVDREMQSYDIYFFTKFQTQAGIYSSYRTAKKEQDGSYSISPVIEHDQLIDFVQHFFLEQPTNNIIEALEEDNKRSYETLLHSKINTYYGRLGFIKSRAKAIVDAIEMIKPNYTLSPDEFQFLEIKLVEALELQQKINNVGTVVVRETILGELITDMTTDEYFDIVIPSIKELLKIEEELSFISQRIWQNYFDTRGAKFVHALSAEIVESDKMPKICTSLYLNDLATIPFGHTGYEYDVSMQNIDCISECDIGSWHIQKTRFLSMGIAHAMQWNEETNMYYEDGYYSKLLPPDYIELKARENNEGQENIKYTEILLMNNQKKISPVRAFYTDLATPEEIEKITFMAQKQGIDVEYIDTKSIKKNMDAKAIS